MKIIEEQRRLLEQTKEDAGRLGSRDAKKDEYYLQVNRIQRRINRIHKQVSTNVKC